MSAVEHKVFPAHRQYNQWVANETLEDFALRFTAKHARKWSIGRIANTALGIVSFLALEAIGGAITLAYGFENAMWAIAAVSIIIFFSGIPICYHAAKSGIDIDLLTRGAGFGYLGSTLSSLIYASFTFIFFALEAAIMSSALEILFGIPILLAYIISAIIVIPLVTHGITRISRFQLLTQPLWALLQFIPLVIVFLNHQDSLDTWFEFTGSAQKNSQTGFNIFLFGAAAAVIFPLIAQNGEQVDYLRFLPDEKKDTFSWWLALLFSGPGWIFIGILKLVAGSFLAVLAMDYGISPDQADDPTRMYIVVFEYLFHNKEIALIVACFFVIISQLKINVTNAYAGSLAWSNFFSRLTNNHPGRIVWLFFNVSIAVLLMELGVYKAFENILITFSSLVLSWIGALVADLVINWHLGLRPKVLEFKRGKLYDINPVGFFSMLLASFIGITAEIGIYGSYIKALAPFIAFFLPFLTAPLIAYLTKGKYYLHKSYLDQDTDNRIKISERCECKICRNVFDKEDILHCPYYAGDICSLCCSLESLCRDQCRPDAGIREQLNAIFIRLLPEKMANLLQSKVGHFFSIFSLTSLLISTLLLMVFFTLNIQDENVLFIISKVLWQVFFLLSIVMGILIWLYVLAENTKAKALDELQNNAALLEKEIITNKQTSRQLELAKEAADSANQSKTRYLSSVSHELRTPLNTVFGYAQLLEKNENLPPKAREAASVILRSSEHLADIIEGLLEISKIEAKRLKYIHKESVNIRLTVEQIVQMFHQQANEKGITFTYEGIEQLPDYASTDQKRFRQILINLISNAIKFTNQGGVCLKISYRNQVAKFVVEDSGIGIKPEDFERIFDPFEQVDDNKNEFRLGTGLGLSISRLLSELLGGDIAVESEYGIGSRFTLSILLPKSTQVSSKRNTSLPVIGYKGPRKTILIADDQLKHRQLICEWLIPLGFTLIQAENGRQAIEKLDELAIDLVFLDIFMPEYNGWEVAEYIKTNGINVPIIMISGNAIEIDEDKMEARLHDAYIIKPVRFDTLLEKIGHHLKLTWLHDIDINLKKPDKTPEPQDINFPDEEILKKITEYCTIGFLNGVHEVIDGLKNSSDFSDFICYAESYLGKLDLVGLKSFIEQEGKR